MKVINCSPVVIEIAGKPIKPNESYEVRESMITEIDVHSDIGSCYINLTYLKKPEVHHYGKIAVKFYGRKEQRIEQIGIFSVEQ